MQSQPATQTQSANEPQSGAAAKLSRRTALWMATAAALFVTVSLWPTPAGLSPEGQRALALLAGVLALWVSEALPLGVTVVLIVLGLLTTQPTMAAEQLLSGFSSQTFFFLFGVLGMGVGVAESGLSRRIAAFVARTARARSHTMFWQLAAMLPVLALPLPSAMTRNAVLIPIYRDVLGGYRHAPAPGLPKAVLLVLGVLNPMASSVTLTGGTVSIAAATLVGGVGWGRWFLWVGIIYVLLFAVGAVAVYFMAGLHRARGIPPSGPGEPVPAEAPSVSPGPWSPAEKRTAAALAAALALWLTDSLHGWPPALPALFALTVLLMPGPGGLSWHRFHQRFSWTVLLTMGGVLSLASTLQTTGAVAWLADRFLGAIGGWSLPEVGVYLLIAAVTMIIHLAVPGFVPTVSLMVPLAMALAPHLGAGTLAAAFTATIATDSVIFYPVQATTSVMAYEQGQTSAKDVLVLGMVMAAAVLVLIPLVVLPYWRWIGLLEAALP